MEQINWRWVALGGAAALAIVAIALWRSSGDSVVVAGDVDATPTATSAPSVTPEPTADPTTAPDPIATTTPTTAPDPTATTAPTAAPEPTAEATTGPAVDAPAATSGTMRCTLYIHGAGTAPGDLSDEVWGDDLLYLTPHSGNTEFPFFWLYDGPHNMQYDPGDSDQPFLDLVSYLTDYLDANDCGPVFMHGASNGGGMAARIYCSGEDFGGRLWAALIDDPVPDAGVVGCAPSSSVQRVLFVHSTELVEKAATFVDDRCSQSDAVEWPWYCMDDIGFDKEEYESHIGQETVWGREEHVGVNTDETNFWRLHDPWWETFDAEAYAANLG